MGASTLNKKELFRLHMGEVKNDYATLMGDCEYYESQIESLQDENDRLREFVQAVTEDVFGGELFDCGGCRFFRGCYNGEEREHEGRGCQWWLWARELGIEVDYDD